MTILDEDKVCQFCGYVGNDWIVAQGNECVCRPCWPAFAKLRYRIKSTPVCNSSAASISPGRRYFLRPL